MKIEIPKMYEELKSLLNEATDQSWQEVVEEAKGLLAKMSGEGDKFAADLLEQFEDCNFGNWDSIIRTAVKELESGEIEEVE